MAIQFISHDLGVISEIADDIAVMYAGRIVERAPAPSIFEAPAHPYTQGLLETVPRIGGRRDMLPAIPGNVPDPARLPSGCAFRDRCARATALCAANPPALETVASDHWAACIRVGH
jgi:oligopeptide/dipeptide ABC transporter ATP-binding protein